jgi:hypothetical protein
MNFSEEHLWYELDMAFGVGKYLSGQARASGPTPGDARRVANLLVEGFAIHVRNLIDFLYPNHLRATDVVAADFCPPGAWEKAGPTISAALSNARTRANKELAHLTTERISGAALEKTWDAVALLTEIVPLLKLWLKTAKPSAASARVRQLIDSI